ncbi:MAG: hypothetical protein SNJ77_02105 [Cytophagales bacterium]
MKTYKFAFLVFAICLFSACEDKNIDTKAFSDELKDRKILHVTQGEISSMAQKAGKIFTDTLAVLLKECNEKGIDNCCDISLYEVVNSFSKDFEAEIKFVQIADSSSLNGLEKEVFDAYLYLLNNKLPMEANVQNLKDGYWLYSQPVINENLNCLAISGSPFSGVWNIKMSQKMIIRNIGK